MESKIGCPTHSVPRLDRETPGLLLTAKNQKTAFELTRQFEACAEVRA